MNGFDIFQVSKTNSKHYVPLKYTSQFPWLKLYVTNTDKVLA